MMSDFTFTGYNNKIYNLRDNGGFMVNKPEIQAPQLRVTEHKVDGRDGYLHSACGDYESRDITLACVFKTYEEAQRLISAFNTLGGILNFNYIEGYFKVERVVAIYTRDAKGIPEVDILLRVKPFSYLPKVTIEPSSNNFNFNNMGEVEARPVIKVVGNGTGTFTLNGHTYTIEQLNTSEFVIDCENWAITRLDNNVGDLLTGNLENVKIIEGDNDIAYSGGISKITIEYIPKLIR